MNVILLPEAAFNKSQTSVIISDEGQLTHLHKVLKTKVGDSLKIGMIDGMLGFGQVAKLTNTQCLLNYVILDKKPPKKLDLTLVLALPRPKVLRRLMLDISAMGVEHIILMNSFRTDKSYWHSPLLSRLDEFVLEGLQQAVDSIPPKITLAKYFKPFVEGSLPRLMKNDTISSNKIAAVAHPYAKMPFYTFSQTVGLPQILFVGAEGGFIPYEIDLLEKMGVDSVGLGDRILRTESAVNALLGRYLA